MKNIKQRIFVVLLLIIVFASFISINCITTAFAFTGHMSFDPSNPTALFTETNTFTCTTYDEVSKVISYDMNERRIGVEVMDSPQITVLTHGWGANAGTWSNKYSAANLDISFAYDENSIIEEISEKAGGANIYWAKMLANRTDFNLIDITYKSDQIKYNDEDVPIEYITDVSKHIIIVFDGYDTSGSNDSIYFQFNHMLSKVVYDVKVLNGGKLPKINLIGHSRGGLTNMQYALDHPDLVASLISIGTPYFGTTTGAIWDLKDDSEGLDSILDPVVYSSYSTRWNQDYNRLYKDINAVAIGGYSSVDFLAECIKNNKSATLSPEEYPILNKYIDCLIELVSSAKIYSELRVSQYELSIEIMREILEFFYPSSIARSVAEIWMEEINFDWRPPFLSWYNDVCVNLDSQLGISELNAYGSYTYTGFKQRIRYFYTGDGTDFDKVAADNVPVPHNLEPRDAKIIQWVVNEIDLGKGRPNGFVCTIKPDNTICLDGYTGEYTPNNFVIPETIEGKTVTEISAFAFEGLFDELGVTAVTLPRTLKVIGEGAFSNNENLTTVNVPTENNLEEIHSVAFANCTSLGSFVIPENVNYLGVTVFYGCDGMDSFNVDSSNSHYISVNGVIYTKSGTGVGTQLVEYPGAKNDSSFTVPIEVQEVGVRAFVGNEYLTSLDLNNVVLLREESLMNCSNLANLTADNIDFVERDALLGTAWLNNQIVSSSYITLGEALYCYNGTEANLDLSSYKSVSPNAFVANHYIENVTFGNNTSTIGAYAYYDCVNLKNVYLYNLNNMIFVGKSTFDSNSTERCLYIPQCLQSEYASNELWDQYDFSIQQTTVNYILNGGTVDGSTEYSNTVQYGGFLDLPTPTREGYIFDGWYSNFINGQVAGTQYVSGDMWFNTIESTDLYAKWVPITYSINLDPAGGNVTPTTINYTIEDTVSLPTPVRAGYSFSGWYKSENYSPEDYVGITLPANCIGNITLYAKWTAIQYTITYNFNINGPGDLQSNTPSSKTVVFGQPYSLDVPSREGHTFNGWKDSNGIFYCNENGEPTFGGWNQAGDITLWADWTRNTYYIKITDDNRVYWVTDEGEFDTYQSPIEYGTELISPQLLAEAFNPDNVSLKEGHMFMYFTKEQGSSQPILSWSEFESLIVNNGDGFVVNIYTYYEKEDNFTINFYYDGSFSQPGVNPFVTEFGGQISYITPVKTGYTFKYWKVATTSIAPTNSRFAGTSLQPGSKFDYLLMPDLSIGTEEEGVHIWLEPYFEPNIYTIYFSTPYGTLPYSSTSIAYDARKNLPVLAAPGRTFLGWYDSLTGGTQIASANGTMISKWNVANNTTVYAHWSTVSYTITFVNGYTHSNSTSFTVDNLPRILSDATRSGYRFMGWYSDSSYTTRVYKITSVGNKTLYAKWAQLFTVSFTTTNGTSCSSITGISGETITLPTSTRNGYKGTWSYWGYLTGNSNVSNFGYSYTIGNSNVKLTVSWKEKTIQECYNSTYDRYEIWTYNQLNSIRDLKTYDSYNQSYKIIKNIYLCSDIVLGRNWTPIESKFSGTFEGNNHTISDMTIVITEPGNYGFFSSIYLGEVNNLKFTNVKISCTSTDNTDYAMVGVVAGSFQGQMNNCKAMSGNITVNLYNAWVGGIVGTTQGGRIYNCDNDGVNISGYGILGGVVGFNGWNTKIQYCDNSGDIIYTFNTESGCAAGIVGRNNMGGSIENCANKGTIKYGGSYAWNSNNRPCMAQIIGWNQDGTYSNVNCLGSCVFTNMTLGQKTYCSNDKVGRTGN